MASESPGRRWGDTGRPESRGQVETVTGQPLVVLLASDLHCVPDTLDLVTAQRGPSLTQEHLLQHLPR